MMLNLSPYRIYVTKLRRTSYVGVGCISLFGIMLIVACFQLFFHGRLRAPLLPLPLPGSCPVLQIPSGDSSMPAPQLESLRSSSPRRVGSSSHRRASTSEQQASTSEQQEVCVILSVQYIR